MAVPSKTVCFRAFHEDLSAANPWDSKPSPPPLPKRIAWPGGKIVSNKDEALASFLRRKLDQGETLTPEQMAMLEKIIDQNLTNQHATATRPRKTPATSMTTTDLTGHAGNNTNRSRIRNKNTSRNTNTNKNASVNMGIGMSSKNRTKMRGFGDGQKTTTNPTVKARSLLHKLEQKVAMSWGDPCDDAARSVEDGEDSTSGGVLFCVPRYRVDLSSVKRGSRAIVGRRGGGGAPPRGKISAFPENKKAVVAGGGGRVGVEVGVESPGEKRRRVIPDGRGGFKIAAKTVTTAITLGRGGNGGGRGGVLSTASDDAEFPPLVSSSSLLSFRQRRSGSGITSNEGRAPKRPSKNYWLGAEKGAAAAIAAAAAARAAATEEKETPTIYDSEATGGSGGREREKGSLYDNVGIINSKKGYTKKENRREKGQGQAASSFKANPAGKGQGQGQQPRQKAQQAKGSQVQKSLEELMSGGLTSSRR